MTNETLTMIMIVAGCVFALASVLYGIFRKFSQMSWLSYQIPLVFFAVMLLGLLPASLSPAMRLILGVAITVGATALIVGGGALLRGAMLRKKMPAHGAWRFLDRVLGGFTALWDYVMIVLVLGCTALSFFAFVYNPLPEMLEPIFAMGIWKNFLAQHAIDLLLVTLLVFAMRGGWRVGFGRVCFILFMLVLSLGAVVLAVYLPLGVPFFGAMANDITGSLPLTGAVAKLVGVIITAFILFVILFVIVCVIGYFLCKLVRRIRYDYFWGTIDGFFGFVLSLAVALALLIGLYIAVSALAQGMFTNLLSDLVARLGEQGASLQPVLDIVKAAESWMQRVAVWLQSAPLSAAFYSNPIAGSIHI